MVSTVVATAVAPEVVSVVCSSSLPADGTGAAADLCVAAIAIIATSTENSAAAEERNCESEESECSNAVFHAWVLPKIVLSRGGGANEMKSTSQLIYDIEPNRTKHKIRLNRTTNIV
ncbi:hypothetical protein SH449x_005437 [Pirellulaceae bacterium SH449]